MATGRLLLASLVVSLCVGRIRSDPWVQDDAGSLADAEAATLELYKERAAGDEESGGSGQLVLLRRNPLGKNFIRFGRVAPKTWPLDASKLTSDYEISGADGTNSGRSQRGLSSNFIRFGRSFDPFRLQEVIMREIEQQQQQQQQQPLLQQHKAEGTANQRPLPYQRMERSLASNFLRFGR